MEKQVAVRTIPRPRGAYRAEIKCVVCGKDFIITRRHTRMYCGKACATKAQIKRQGEQKRQETLRLQREMLERPVSCLFCDVVFKRTHIRQVRCPKCIKNKIESRSQYTKKNPTAHRDSVVVVQSRDFCAEFTEKIYKADLKQKKRLAERVRERTEIDGETEFKEEIENFLAKGGKVKSIPAETEAATSFTVNSTTFSYHKYGETSKPAFGLPKFLGAAICGEP